MITGRWGKPSHVLLDIVVEPDGVVRGVVNPGRQNASIRRGQFDAATGAVHLEAQNIFMYGHWHADPAQLRTDVYYLLQRP